MVGLVLVQHYPRIYPSIERIVDWSSLSRRSVIRGIQELEASGVITVTRADGQRSVYTFNLCHTGTGATQAPVPNLHATSATQAPPPVPNLHPTLNLQSKISNEADPVVPPQDAQAQPQRWWTLDGWEPSAELRSEATAQGITALEFERRLAELRLGPIGGNRGVLDRTAYVRTQLPKWRVWSETERAKALSQGATGSPKRFATQVATHVPTDAEKALAGRYGVELETVLADFVRRGYTTENYPAKDLARYFASLLKLAIKDARERTTPTTGGSDRDRQGNGEATPPGAGGRYRDLLGVRVERSAAAEPALRAVPREGVEAAQHPQPVLPTTRADGGGQEGNAE